VRLVRITIACSISWHLLSPSWLPEGHTARDGAGAAGGSATRRPRPRPRSS
jgi:hypothetical protein